MRKPRYLFNEDAEELYHKLSEIYNEIISEKRVDVFGDIDFEIVDKIDGKDNRIAKIKGNKIFVKVSTLYLPRGALKYIIAHELAHTIVKDHTKRYWDIVRTIYPEFEEGKNLLLKYKDRL